MVPGEPLNQLFQVLYLVLIQRKHGHKLDVVIVLSQLTCLIGERSQNSVHHALRADLASLLVFCVELRPLPGEDFPTPAAAGLRCLTPCHIYRVSDQLRRVKKNFKKKTPAAVCDEGSDGGEVTASRFRRSRTSRARRLEYRVHLAFVPNRFLAGGERLADACEIRHRE